MATADAVGSLAMTASVLLNISPFRDVHGTCDGASGTDYGNLFAVRIMDYIS